MRKGRNKKAWRESWPEKKKTLGSIRRVEIELQSGRKEGLRGTMRPLPVQRRTWRREREGEEGGEEGLCTAARDLEGTRNRGSVPKRDPLMRTRSTVLDQPGWPRSGAGAR